MNIVEEYFWELTLTTSFSFTTSSEGFSKFAVGNAIIF